MSPRNRTPLSPTSPTSASTIPHPPTSTSHATPSVRRHSFSPSSSSTTSAASTSTSSTSTRPTLSIHASTSTSPPRKIGHATHPPSSTLLPPAAIRQDTSPLTSSASPLSISSFPSPAPSPSALSPSPLSSSASSCSSTMSITPSQPPFSITAASWPAPQSAAYALYQRYYTAAQFNVISGYLPTHQYVITSPSHAHQAASPTSPIPSTAIDLIASMNAETSSQPIIVIDAAGPEREGYETCQAILSRIYQHEFDTPLSTSPHGTISNSNPNSNSNSNSNPNPNPTININIHISSSIDTTLEQAYRSAYDSLDNWEKFDIFSLAEITNGWPLSFLFVTILRREGLFEQCSLDPAITYRFIQEVETNYLPNPYHTATHAADVLHGAYHMVQHSFLKTSLSAWDKLALYISSSVHDYAHPGVNNSFLVNSRAPLAIRYNDRSVLESHHVSSAFHMMLTKSGCNILNHLSIAEWGKIRKLIIDLVLATDLASHFEILGLFKRRSSLLDLTLEEDRSLVMQMCLKCGDLSHPSRPRKLHLKWSELVTEEFFQQGDRERVFSLPPSMFMDRRTTNLAKSQIGFITFLVSPMYKDFSMFIENMFWSNQVETNLEMWQSALAEEEKENASAATNNDPPNDPPIVTVTVAPSEQSSPTQTSVSATASASHTNDATPSPSPLLHTLSLPIDIHTAPTSSSSSPTTTPRLHDDDDMESVPRILHMRNNSYSAPASQFVKNMFVRVRNMTGVMSDSPPTSTRTLNTDTPTSPSSPAEHVTETETPTPPSEPITVTVDSSTIISPTMTITSPSNMTSPGHDMISPTHRPSSRASFPSLSSPSDDDTTATDDDVAVSRVNAHMNDETRERHHSVIYTATRRPPSASATLPHPHSESRPPTSGHRNLHSRSPSLPSTAPQPASTSRLGFHSRPSSSSFSRVLTGMETDEPTPEFAFQFTGASEAMLLPGGYLAARQAGSNLSRTSTPDLRGQSPHQQHVTATPTIPPCTSS